MALYSLVAIGRVIKGKAFKVLKLRWAHKKVVRVAKERRQRELCSKIFQIVSAWAQK
jgi:hypothetical protein